MGGLVGRPLELCGMLVRALGVSAFDAPCAEWGRAGSGPGAEAGRRN